MSQARVRAVEVNSAVPYFAQWESADLIEDIVCHRLAARDDPLWWRSGARTAAEYEFWSWRSCGIACLQMLLAARTDPVPPAFALGMELLAAGAYTLREGGLDGLNYAPFVAYLRERWGMTAQVRVDLDPDGLYDLVAGGARVLASVHPSVRDAPADPPRRGGHLVLVHDVNDADDSLVFHNPSGTTPATQASARLSRTEFARYFASRGVVVGDLAMPRAEVGGVR